MRPINVEQLIEDLRTENGHSRVGCTYRSKMRLTIKGSEPMDFDADESKLLLRSVDAVEQLFEAIDYPDHVAVELHGLDVEDDVLTKLEELSETVDEL